MLNFDQFVNESKDHDFESIKKGDHVLWMGGRYAVKKAADGVIVLEGRGKDIRVNKGMWKQRGGSIVEKKEDSHNDEK
jgi:preprotein translocase subunit YajC